MNEIIKALLQEEKNALKVLHDEFLIDFNKPIFTKTISGKFTANQIIKEAAAAGFNPYNSIIITATSGIKYHNDIFTAQITADNIIIDQRFFLYSNGNYKSHKIHAFWRKSDFNEYRKQDGITTYIIAQKTSDLAPKNEHKVDYTARFKVNRIDKWCYQCGGESYIGRLDLIRTDDNGTHAEYNNRGRVIYKGRDEYKTIDELIDKSGYIVNGKRDELKRRANGLKADRAKAAYIKTDNAAIIAELENLYRQTRAAIIAELEKAETVEAYKTISNKLGYFHGIADALDDLERLKARDAAREYSSIEKFTAAAESIRNKFNTLKEGRPEA